MAEFKLGRIRFVWKGSWNASTTYYRDDVIRYGGRLYICVIGHESQSDFYSDLDISPPKWNLVSDGQNWKGDWSTNTSYVYNDIVKNGSGLYICNTVHTSAATTNEGLEADQSKWDSFAEGLDWLGEWNVGTRYKVNDFVKYGGQTYVCNTLHTSAATTALGLESDQSKWDYFNKGLDYVGNWTTGYRYKANDVVKWGSGLYVCNTYHTSAAFADDEEKWTEFVQGLSYENDWSVFVLYQPGDVVTYGGWQFVAKTLNTGQVPSTATDDWDVLSKGFNFVGDWGDDSSNQDYRVGDVVRVGAYTYVCIQDHNAQKPPNATFWERLNAGFNWRGAWLDDQEYVEGDVVRYGANSYVCVDAHISEGDDYSSELAGAENSRPDQDTAGQYWAILSIGSEASILTTKGDILYYSGSGPTRLPIGQEGEILTVSSDGVPEWQFLGDNPDVYYVSTAGVDSPAPIRGNTLDRPWKSIRYACMEIDKGTKNPQARKLLELNRKFIQREAVEWTDYQITNNTAPFTSAFEYSETKCERDIGYIVDALIWDVTHGGNVRSREAAIQYRDNASQFYTLGQEEETVASINQALSIIGKVLAQTDPTQNYQTLNGDNSTATVAQYKDSTLSAESTVLGQITELVELMTDAITAGSDAVIPGKDEPGSLIKVATGTYEEYLPISVPAKCCVMGDELRAVTVKPKVNNLTPERDVKFSYVGMTRMEEILPDVVQGISVTPTTGNTETQSQEWPIGSSSEGDVTAQLVRALKNRVDAGIGNKLAVDINRPSGRAIQYEYARNLLIQNKKFIQAEVLAYITANYSTLKYSRTKCKQDIGFIIDALGYDLIYDGNWQSTNAGLAYFNGRDGSLQIASSEKTATLAAYAYMKSILPAITRAQAVNPILNSTETQIVGSPGNATTSSKLEALMDVITGIIDNGPGSATITYPDISFVDENLLDASSKVLSAYPEIKEKTIDFISKNFGSFKFNSEVCRRDLRNIITDTAYDVALGTNYNGVFNGIAYTRPINAYNINNQRVETVGAIRNARDELKISVTTDGSSASGSSNASDRIDTAFNEIVNTIQNATTPATPGDGVASALTFPSPVGVDQNRVDAKDNLIANRNFIAADVVAYVNNNTPPAGYNQDKCSRDVKYIVDALCYDILYQGTQAITRITESYFGIFGAIYPAGQVTETVAAYNHMSSIIQTIVQENTVTAQSGNGLSQTKPGTPATGTEATELGNKMTILTDALTAGNTNSVPAVVYPTITWADAEYQTAKSNMDSDREDVITSTIQFINTNYSDFNYNQTKCSRDVGLLLDAARYDWMLNSNFGTTVAALSYLREPSSKVVGNQKTATIAAFEFARSLAVQSVGGNAYVINYINSLWEITQDTLFAGSSEGNNKQTDVEDVHAAVRQIRLNKDFIAAEVHAHIDDYFSSTVTDTDDSTDVLTTTNTDWLTQNMAIRFRAGDDSSNSLTSSGLAADTTYYVKDILSSTTFTISNTIGGTAFNIAENENAGFEVYAEYEYNFALCQRDIISYLDAIIYDLQIPQIYKREYTDGITLYRPGCYKTRLAARYYINSVKGSQEEDMYYLRNATGLRLQTLDGLNGDLGPANAYGTSRPTAGAYASLDPGWGPDDQLVWITERSPYVQNLTTFGNAATGQRIDGALHNGGNDSIVSNDFTQVISDGIGAHILNNGRAELVSVFTYYSHIGYLAESGGRIRATNGNNSYGDFGSVAEGIDPEEIPVTAIVDNLGQFVAVMNAVTDTEELLAFEFQHAGNDYTKANINIFGAGTGAEAEVDEFRDNAVFQTRILDIGDSSGSFGGSNYLISANTAQTGTTTSLSLAATDGQPDSAYPGMKVYINGGAGAGQYGIIQTYSSGSKLASVIRESDGVAGWDHIVAGTTIVSPNSSSTYQIEPAVSFTPPPFSSAASTKGANTQSITNGIFGETAAEYTSVTGTSNGDGTSATFDITKVGSKYYVEFAGSGSSTGVNYSRLDTVTILGSSIGGIDAVNDLTITASAINSATGAITAFDFAGFGNAGIYLGSENGSNNIVRSVDGTNWTTVTLTGGAAFTDGVVFAHGLLDDGSSTYTPSRFVAVGSAGTADQVYYSDNGVTWTAATLGAGPHGTGAAIAFDGTNFVLIFGNDLGVYRSADGITWNYVPGVLPGTGFADTTRNRMAYGAGKFVLTGGSGNLDEVLHSVDGLTWVSASIASTSVQWENIVYGNGRFIATGQVAAAQAGREVAYSLDRGVNWTYLGQQLPAGSGQAYPSITYGHGVFLTLGGSASTGQTSEDGVNWTERSLVNSSSLALFGNPQRLGTFIAFGTGSVNDTEKVFAGARARGRVGIAAEKVFEIRMVEPGSNYTGPVPAITITDPNNINDVQTQVRVGNGALGNPSFVNRGSGYQQASAEIDKPTSNGVAEFFQSGSFVAVRRLSERPVSGSNVVFDSLPGQVFKLVNIVSFIGSVDGSYTAFLNLSPQMAVEDAPPDGDGVTMRVRYSQVRLTGHDFLDIGTGGFADSNYPGTPLINPDPTKETQESQGGRVFYTSTDQDGNFRVGDLFTIEQATGVATLNADAFNISGLQELSLGEVTLGGNSASITEFSTDPFFTANSDTIIPTQRAIKSYIEQQIGGGGASLIVNTVTAGDIFIGTNVITTLENSTINIRATTNFVGGVTGLPVAINYFLR